MPKRKRRTEEKETEQTERLSIRLLRLFFFAFIIGFVVYLYYLYEKGEAGNFIVGIGHSILSGITTLLSTLWGFLQQIQEVAIQYPVAAVGVLINNLFFIFIGYLIAMRRG